MGHQRLRDYASSCGVGSGQPEPYWLQNRLRNHGVETQVVGMIEAPQIRGGSCEGLCASTLW